MTTTTTTQASRAPGHVGRLMALARAEYLQFRRNTTLVVMGVLFPVAIPLVPFFIGVKDDKLDADLMATTFEIFALMALLFVQYYSVLSMVTARRSRGVLKRLRTSEAADWQILLAPMVPGAVLSTAGMVLVTVVTYGFGGPAPVNPVAMAVAIVGGIVAFSVLALATSVYTRNTEAAQITSLPLMAVAMVGLGSLRETLPERMADVVTWTPFAAVSDLMSLGTSGRLATAADGTAALDLAATFGHMVQPVAILVVWTAIALEIARRGFRWDDRG